MLQINNTDIPAPSSFSVGIQDISDAERNAYGEMLIDRIATKRKIEMQWDMLSPEELSTLLTLVGNVFFYVRYPDPMTANFETKTFYVGDRTVPGLVFINGAMMWKNVKFNIIEK